jgi:UDP-2,3-diacylglucosamine pyrophosphatase LpxH
VERLLHIISDIHVGEGPLDDFESELQELLIAFLRRLVATSVPVELVINGDFLDFAQASPWSGATLESETGDGIPLCFTLGQSLQKFNAIHDAHRALFDAFAWFLSAKPENRLTILPGNHDADLFWPEVRQAFEAALPGRRHPGQLVFICSRNYRPDNRPWLWIEHGHQFDPINAFFVGVDERWSESEPPILFDRNGEARLLECVGTRFLIRHLNALDARYPYVDNVKPFSRFLKLFGASALSPGFAPLDAAVAVSRSVAWATHTVLTKPGDLLSAQGPDGKPLLHPLFDWIKRANPAQRLVLAEALRTHGLSFPYTLDVAIERPADSMRVLEVVADHPELVSGIGERDASLLGAEPGYLTMAKGFVADETKLLQAGARIIAEAHPEITAVVMGHTHEPFDADDGVRYLNLGSWTRYWQADNKATQPWTVLKEKSYERFPYRLASAVVAPGSTIVELEVFAEKGRL